MEVLRAVRGAARLRAASERDLTAPEGGADLALELEAPGVLHPALVPWVAACVGEPAEALLAAWTSGDDGDLRASLPSRLRRARPPEALAALGVQPKELLLRRLPVPAGAARENRAPPAGGPPVLSSLNAHYQELLRTNASVAALRRLRGPDIIIEERSRAVQRCFLRLLAVLRGEGPPFEASDLPGLESDGDRPLIGMPRCCADFVREPIEPRELALCGDRVLLRFDAALVQLELPSGAVHVAPFGPASLVRSDADEAIFFDGAQLVVWDLAQRRFVLTPRSLPARVALGACCGVEVLDTATRRLATLPGPMASSGFDLATSPCGAYVWPCVLPACDDLGVFSLEAMERAYLVWPNGSLGTPRPPRRRGEGHDGTARALVRRGPGFRFLYGRHVLDGERAHELPRAPQVACFDGAGERLATVAGEELVVYQLAADGAPAPAARWSIRELRAHPTLHAPVKGGAPDLPAL